MEAELKRIHAAARTLRAASRERKDGVLISLSELLATNESDLLEANARDLKALPASASAAFRDRLTLNPQRVAQMRESLRQVAALDDPVGEAVDSRTLASGLRARRVRSPLGVIFMIFESRPNVAVEAFSLSFKAGNATILRGGKESMATTARIYAMVREALRANGFSEACVWGIEDPDRALVSALLQQKRWIDVVVPRGGDALIEFVVKNSSIPIIKNDRGLCHVYIHEDADLDTALKVAVNAKTQRPGVCNATETFLVHRSLAAQAIPRLYEQTDSFKLEWFGCPETERILKGRARVHAASPESFDTEYLDYKVSCRVVGSLDEAIAHIEEHGSRHSEAIVTRSEEMARKFQNEIDAAVVYWNASTRFTDGFEFGLGGELGISTQKLHVRGPVGLRELTSVRWIVDGKGQVRT